MVALLDLVEPIALRVAADGAISPVSPAAAAWLAGRADAGLEALFGAASPAALRAQAEAGEKAAPPNPWPEGPASWDLSLEAPDAVLAIGAALRPSRALAAQLAPATLLDKSLALAVLPRELAAPLGERLQPKAYREATVMFIDAVQFSRLAARVDPVTCLKQLDFFFSAFDQITSAFAVEKLRTAGDTYVAVAGIPQRRPSHAVEATFAALRCAQVVASGLTPIVDEWDWSFRIGLHAGPCISGVLGAKKPVYDLWGDTVSIAAHVERVGQADAVCVSGAVRQLIEPFFALEFLQTTTTRSVGDVEVFAVRGLLPELQGEGEGVVANETFKARYEARFGSACPAAALEALGVELGQGLDEF